MLVAIAQAQDYILLQSYIINSDRIGEKFKQALIDKAQQGVRVSLLYDKIGSRKLSSTYLKSLREHGIDVGGFGSSKRKRSKYFCQFGDGS